MLMAALELKEVFSCLDTSDLDYKESPSMDDWKQVKTLCTYLKLLYDAANILTGSTYSTANVFFHEVVVPTFDDFTNRRSWHVNIYPEKNLQSLDSVFSDLMKVTDQDQMDLSNCYCLQFVGGTAERNDYFSGGNGPAMQQFEEYIMHQGKGFQCTALFSLLNSPICTLQYANSGTKLAVGFEYGRVAVLDISSLSVLFLKDCVSGSSSPVISIVVKAFTSIRCLINSPKHSRSKSPDDPAEGIMFILTRDTTLLLPIVSLREAFVSELSNENHPQQSFQDSDAKNEHVQTNTCSETNQQEVHLHTSSETTYPVEIVLDSLVLLCCEDALRLNSLKSVIQGDMNSIRKVNLLKPCCWTTTFKKDGKVCGLILLYQTGDIEIRSLADLEVVGENSLMAILRWSFKANMDKTMSSSDNGQITLVDIFLAFLHGSVT
ncbi:hypothetical protein HHK36_019853 [Tetracentron sinense]|uniref:Uncharacterized protein n=1 Tax=Tetracentron sinense TaxID=13715 RepID=A0A835D9H6_TETSI|nr:hypothetical protein HHK36_019853 [Tetracentron sinense]